MRVFRVIRPLSSVLLLAVSAAPSVAQFPRHASWPEVSPDGKHVLFLTSRDSGSGSIYVMNADGTDEHRLASGISPGWFPDSKRFLFIEPDSHLIVMNIDGTGRHEVPLVGMSLWRPNVAPDGKTIAFTDAPRGKPSTLYTVNVDGTGLRALPTTVPGFENTWSHDGRLAFVSWNRDSMKVTRSTTLYFIKPDGSDQRAVVTVPNVAQWISWSFDGRLIAMQDEASTPANSTGYVADGKIVVVDVQTGKWKFVTPHSRRYLDETPSWTPDGHLYFQSSREGQFDVYRMNADGSAQQRISKN